MTIPRGERTRFGIRARLLTLLLPSILLLLAIDSWNDYRALAGLVQDAYDQSMLQSVNTLRAGISIGPDRSFRLDTRTRELALANGTALVRQIVHVGLTEQPAAGTAVERPGELLLFGQADLPAAPAASSPMAPTGPAAVSSIWYDAQYQDRPMRLLARRELVADGRGRSYELLIQAAESTEPRDQALAASSRQALWRDVRMVAVVVLLVSLGVTWSLRPLERLRRSVQDNQDQDLAPLDTRSVPHEVATLVDTVNHHIAQHRDMLAQQAQFLSDASHQLRTPLAIMMTQAGVALREKDPEQLRATLHAILAQIARSRRLCEQLLSLAYASGSTPAVDAAASADLRAIAKEVVLQYLTLAHEKGQDLGWMDGRDGVSAPALRVRASAVELHEALANLVHNAIVHTPAGGRITVTVGSREGIAFAEVCDNGPGISPGRRAEVFERFRRTADPAAQGTAAQGRSTGLGLAIANAYVRRNGGDITLADASDAGPADPPAGTARTPGLCVTVRLPLAD